MDAKWTVSVSLDLPDTLTLGDRDRLLEHLRGHGFATLTHEGRVVAIQWQAEDEWVLRGLVEDAVQEAEANFNEVMFPMRDGPEYTRWQGEAEGFA